MSEFVVRNFQASDMDAVIGLFKSISEKHQEVVFWWPGEEEWMWEYVYCVFEENQLIAKGQVRAINVFSETSDPNAKHKIFMNIKMHPDWETNSEVYDALYRKLLAKAQNIKETLPASCGTKLCVGNYATEIVNTQYYLDRGFTHFSSLFWMERNLADEIQPVPLQNPALEVRKWMMETEEEEQQYLEAEQAVFKEDADGLERLREYKANPHWIAIGAFHQGELVGHLMAWQEAESKGMIETVFVKSDWRRQGIASFLLTEGLTYLKTLGLATAELLVLTDNALALKVYTSVGFEVLTEERRYWIDLE